MKNNDFPILTKYMFSNINVAYEYISNIFEQNKVIIKEIKYRKSITLLFKLNIDNNEKDIEIILLYNKKNILSNNIINNEIKNLKIEINNIKNNNNNWNKYVTGIKINNKSKNNELINYSNPENISFSNIITKDSYTGFLIDNAFSVFKSIDNILLLIYTNINKTIFSYNLINNQILNKIKNAHEDCITSIRNYIDSI